MCDLFLGIQGHFVSSSALATTSPQLFTRTQSAPVPTAKGMSMTSFLVHEDSSDSSTERGPGTNTPEKDDEKLTLTESKNKISFQT